MTRKKSKKDGFHIPWWFFVLLFFVPIGLYYLISSKDSSAPPVHRSVRADVYGSRSAAHLMVGMIDLYAQSLGEVVNESSVDGWVSYTLANPATHATLSIRLHLMGSEAGYYSLSDTNTLVLVSHHLDINRDAFMHENREYKTLAMENLFGIVNSQTSVYNIPHSKMRGLVSGQIDQWSAIDHQATGEVLLGFRDSLSGTAITVLDHMGLGYQDLTSQSSLLKNDEEVVKFVAKTPNSWGIIGEGSLIKQTSSQVRTVYPDRILKGRRNDDFFRQINLSYHRDIDREVLAFIEFTQTTEVRKHFAEWGYLNP